MMNQKRKRKVVPLKTVQQLKAEKVILDQDLAESLHRAREMQEEINALRDDNATLRAQIGRERLAKAGLLLDIKNTVHAPIPNLEMSFFQRFRVRWFPKSALRATARYVQTYIWCCVTNLLNDHTYERYHTDVYPAVTTGPATTIRKEGPHA